MHVTIFHVGKHKKLFYDSSQITVRVTNVCCILRSSGEERIVDVVPRGTELELELRREVGQAAHTLNNPQVKCTGVY